MATPTKYITDLGGSVTLVATDTKEEIVLGRYGVWERDECIATGDSLYALQAEYGPCLPVYPLQGSTPACRP